MEVEIYTDGACSGNPGKGGYAFIALVKGNMILKISGIEKYTTNNRMELKAISRALEHLEKIFKTRKTKFIIYSDSAYCINPIQKGWLNFWKENNWKTKQGELIKNYDLWMKISRSLNNSWFSFEFIKVKGHSGNKYNELVDKAAKDAINRLNLKKDYQE